MEKTTTSWVRSIVAVGFVFWVFAVTVASAAEVAPATAGPEGERAFRDLGAYYASEDPAKQLPPYSAAIADLSAADPAEASAAGEYLVALLSQALADETNGRAAFAASPFFGERAKSSARELRKQIAGELAEKAGGPAAVGVLKWLVASEGLPEGLAAAVRMLPRVEGPEVEKLISELLVAPHPNAQVAITTIREAGRRKLTACAMRVSELRGSYRKAIREAAEEASKVFGDAKPFVYDPAEAFTPWLREQLAEIGRMVPVSVPTDAKWAELKISDSSVLPLRYIEDRWSLAHAGFVIGNDATDLLIVDWFGQIRRSPKALTKKVEKPFRDVIKEVLELQSDEEQANVKLSDYWYAGPRFENFAVRLPLLLMAAWSIERGDRKSAAALLFPVMDALPDERWLVEIARAGLGNRIHHAMLKKFTHQRDYASALELAKVLSRPEYAGFAYRDRAQELARQLPERSEDFKTLRLPTPAEWAGIKQSMSREEQIRYLAARLRLLNCIQGGQPSDLDYRDSQYGDEEGKVEVINPYVELSQMWMDPKELMALVPSVASDDFILGFSYWRDFHPSRSLHRVRWVLAELFFQVAREDLILPEEYDQMDEEARRAHLEKVMEWCRANAQKTNADLLRSHLATTQEAGRFLSSARESVKRQLPGVTEVLLRRLPDFSDETEKIAESVARSKDLPPLEVAKSWFGSAEPRVQVSGALLLIRAGAEQKAEAYEVLTKIFADKESGSLHRNAIGPLLDLQSGEASALACAITNYHGEDPQYWGTEMLRLIQTGRPEILDYWIKALDDRTVVEKRTEKVGGKTRVVSETRGERAAEGLVRLRKGCEDFDRAAAKASRNRELKQWIRKQFELIRSGKPSGFLDVSARTAADGSMLQ